MEEIKIVQKMRSKARELRQMGRRVALVPTMGALHPGHLKLVEKARSIADTVILSAYVNPRQFNDPQDLEKYPRDPDGDKKKAEQAGVDIFFSPRDVEMYPPGFLTTVNVGYLDRKFEGEHRPGHFRGVCTVVTKLLNITHPNTLVMGWKDAQQLTIIQHMIDDLCLDVSLVGVATVRDEDGLACSSRNGLLSADDRKKALCMGRALKRVHFLVKRQGILHSGELLGAIRSTIEGEGGVKLEYAQIVSRATLEPLDHVMRGGTFVLLAITVNGVRLIDNTRI